MEFAGEDLILGNVLVALAAKQVSLPRGPINSAITLSIDLRKSVGVLLSQSQRLTNVLPPSCAPHALDHSSPRA